MLRSHPGSTFGGLIIGPEMLRAPKLVELVADLDAYAIKNSFEVLSFIDVITVFIVRPVFSYTYGFISQTHNETSLP